MIYFYSFAVFGPKLTEQSNIQFGVNNPRNFRKIETEEFFRTSYCLNIHIGGLAVFITSIWDWIVLIIQQFLCFLKKRVIKNCIRCFFSLMTSFDLCLCYKKKLNGSYQFYWLRWIDHNQNQYHSKSSSWWSFPFRWSVLLLQELPGASSASLAASWIRYKF